MPERQELGRIGVIDIGSNSIRLVVYDGPWRGFVTLFNEKVLCALGRGVAATGRLNPEGVALAMPNLVRFVRLADAMGVRTLDLYATAAVRDARDGRDFVAVIERTVKRRVRVLSGEEEAHLSALGVVAGIPDADGLAGDLGGGSLEFVGIEGGVPGTRATLGLGPFRLLDAYNEDPEATVRMIDRELADLVWLDAFRNRTFYPVGGVWRAIARIRMEQTDYPLKIIHTYQAPRKEIESLARVVRGLGPRSLAQLSGVSRRRAETLPLGALVLERLLRRVKPRQVVFSAYGLREGIVYSRLPAEEQARDPLIAACEDAAARESRFGDLGPDLFAWTAPLFADEPPQLARLRLAACHLSDITWRAHPDYRAEQAMLRALRAPFVGLDHAGRAFLAVTAYARYEGIPEGRELDAAFALLDAEGRRQAIRLGLALRLAYTICGGAREVLRRSQLLFENRTPRLILPEESRVPGGDAVERRLAALARAFDIGATRILP